MIAPSLLDELASEAKWLRKAAEEIAKEGHAGWGNTCTQAAECIERHHATIASMAKRLEAAERDARGEREETWEIWEYDMCVAGADDLGDAQHYLTMYGQDGPVKLVRVISYRETVTPDAIAAATQEGEG